MALGRRLKWQDARDESLRRVEEVAANSGSNDTGSTTPPSVQARQGDNERRKDRQKYSLLTAGGGMGDDNTRTKKSLFGAS